MRIVHDEWQVRHDAMRALRMEQYQAAYRDAARRKAYDTRVGLIAQGLNTALRADPDALRELDVWAWATRIVEETWPNG